MQLDKLFCKRAGIILIKQHVHIKCTSYIATPSKHHLRPCPPRHSLLHSHVNGNPTMHHICEQGAACWLFGGETTDPVFSAPYSLRASAKHTGTTSP